jgi:hypothetical protein
MTTRKMVTAKDGEQAIAMLGRERAGRERTGYATEMRRCTGSARFGIEPHEAPVSTFPKQPSRKDGLGTMCAEHWKAYVKGLREARAAGSQATPEQGAGPAESLQEPAKATTKRERRRTPMAHLPTATRRRRTRSAAPSTEVAAAEALIAEVDALPADEHVKRVGEADVQAALSTSAASTLLPGRRRPSP